MSWEVISFGHCRSYWINSGRRHVPPVLAITAARAHQGHKHLHALQVPALALQLCVARVLSSSCRSFAFVLRIARTRWHCVVCALRKVLQGGLADIPSGAQRQHLPRHTAVARAGGRQPDTLATIMADNKRQSMAGKVATPAVKVSGGSNKDVGDADSTLYKAVGSR